MKVRQQVRYIGHVQGVGFRMTAVSHSRGLNIHGYVCNEPDGSVLMEVEGSPADVKEIQQRIDATMRDNIDDVLVEELPPQGIESGFGIRH